MCLECNKENGHCMKCEKEYMIEENVVEECVYCGGNCTGALAIAATTAPTLPTSLPSSMPVSPYPNRSPSPFPSSSFFTSSPTAKLLVVNMTQRYLEEEVEESGVHQGDWASGNLQGDADNDTRLSGDRKKAGTSRTSSVLAQFQCESQTSERR